MAPLSNSLFEKINQNLKINQICEFNSSVVYYQDNKSEQITVKVWTECTVKPSELLARLHLCLFFYWFGNHLYPLSEQQATNRFHNGCMQGAEGLPQHVWMNHTQASAPLLEAANSLFLPSCGHRTTWTAQLCWDRAQHKQPRPVCFIHHPHHFLLESICGLSRIWEIGGLKKRDGKYDTTWKMLIVNLDIIAEPNETGVTPLTPQFWVSYYILVDVQEWCYSCPSSSAHFPAMKAAGLNKGLNWSKVVLNILRFIHSFHRQTDIFRFFVSVGVKASCRFLIQTDILEVVGSHCV